MNQYQNPYYMVPQRRPRAWINGTLIILNILYFLYLELTGSTQDTYFMLEHGAMYGPLILRGHEYYRLLTSIFMHFGIDHIVNNMLVLFVLGDNLERALGKVKYLIFYLSCGVLANVVSLLFAAVLIFAMLKRIPYSQYVTAIFLALIFLVNLPVRFSVWSAG